MVFHHVLLILVKEVQVDVEKVETVLEFCYLGSMFLLAVEFKWNSNGLTKQCNV